MSLTPFAPSRRPFDLGGKSLPEANRLHEELQEKRIKEVVLPILAVLGGFFLFPFDVAILFTAVVIFGVFICGNGSVESPLPREEPLFFDNVDTADASITPSKDIATPMNRNRGKTPQPPLATPLGVTPTFKPTPGTVQRIAASVGLTKSDADTLSLAVNASPNTFVRQIPQMGRIPGPSLEVKQPRTPVGEREELVVQRNLAADFALPPVPEDQSDET